MSIIQLRRGTAAEWTAANPILAVGELGVELDTLAYKIGNGVTAWNSLTYRQLTGIFNGALVLEAIANPSIPSPGSMSFYAHSYAGRAIPKWIGPSGLDNPVQSALYSNGILMAMPGTASSFSVLGCTITSAGTVTHPGIASGINFRSSIRRGNVASAATANSVASLRIPASVTYRGEAFSGVSTGGFFCVTRFGIATAVANQRGAFGLVNSLTAPAATQVMSALTNCIVVGWDSGDANLSIMHNDGADSCTKIDLGSNFPVNTTAVYELILFCAPNGDTVGYRVKRLDTDVSTSGIINSNIPMKSTALTWTAQINNGGTAAAVSFDLMRMYIETDF